MLELLAQYWPAVAAAFAALFLKKDNKAVWKIIKDRVVKPVPTISPSPDKHEADVAQLVECASAVAIRHPDFDISVVIDDTGTDVKVKSREPK